MIFIYDEFPLALAKLINPSVPEWEQDSVARAMAALRRCCLSPVDGLTWRFAEGVQEARDARTPEKLAFLQDVFNMCDPSNISFENRFATTRRHATDGSTLCAATVASNHCLSELKHFWEETINAFDVANRPAPAADRDIPRSRVTFVGGTSSGDIS